jgi:hypothetical protein
MERTVAATLKSSFKSAFLHVIDEKVRAGAQLDLHAVSGMASRTIGMMVVVVVVIGLSARGRRSRRHGKGNQQQGCRQG